MRDIALFSGFIAMLVAGRAFRFPHIGVLLWCWTALVSPNFFVYGFASVIPYNKVVAIITLLVWMFSMEPKRLPRNSSLVLIGLIGFVGTISALTSISKTDAAMREWENFIKIIIFAFVVAGIMTSKERIIALLYAVLLSLGFHGVLSGAKYIASGGSSHLYGPGASIIGDNNHFALAMIVLLPIIFFLRRQTEHRMLRMGLAGSVLLVVATVMGTASRGGLLGAIAVGGLAFLRSRQKFRNAIVALPLIIAAVFFAPQKWTERMDTIQTANQDSSFMGRVIAWKQSTLIALDHPVLGGGFFAVQDYDVWMKYAAEFSKLDFIPTDLPSYEQPYAAHSIYFQTLGDMGFLGLGLLIALLISAWRNASETIRLVRDRPGWEWAGDLAKTLQYSVFAYAVSGAALSMAYFDCMYMIYAILAVIRELAARGQNSTNMVRA